jgi:hypothetical protein
MKQSVRLTWKLALLMLCGSAVSCYPQYRIIPGKVDVDGFPTSSASICLGGTGNKHCYVPSSEKYVFALDPKAQDVAKHNGKNLVLFTATFSGGGSGTLTSFALLEEQAGELVDLLPTVQLTNQSEYRLWNLPSVSGLPVLVTADFIWDFDAAQKSDFTQETHFAAHRYAIRVYLFDAASGHYLQKVHYDTNEKYPGLDDVDQIKVLDSERQRILDALRPEPPK